MLSAALGPTRKYSRGGVHAPSAAARAARRACRCAAMGRRTRAHARAREAARPPALFACSVQQHVRRTRQGLDQRCNGQRCTHTHTHIQIYIHTYIYIHILACVRARVCACVRARLCVPAWLCVRACTGPLRSLTHLAVAQHGEVAQRIQVLMRSPTRRMRHDASARSLTASGLAPATSAPGLGSPPPHLHRDWADPRSGGRTRVKAEAVDAQPSAAKPKGT
jgi:hypothetical protein